MNQYALVDFSDKGVMELDQYLQVVSKLNDDELVLLRAKIDAEFAKRGIQFNVGVLGERLSIAFFNSTPGLPNLLQAPTGAKNVDALSRDGDRYSIKAFMKAKKTGTIYPDVEDPDKRLFEYVVVVRLDKDYQMNAIYRYSWEDFVKVRAWDKRMNAWYIPLSKRNLNLAEPVFQK
jgi:hypothetical protein